MKILIKTQIDKNYNFCFSKFDEDLFKFLKPPLLNLEVERFDGCKKGDEIHLGIGLGPFSMKWISHITENSENDEENLFIDEGHLLPPLSLIGNIYIVSRRLMKTPQKFMTT